MGAQWAASAVHPSLHPPLGAGLCKGAVRCSNGACLQGAPKLHLLGAHHGCSSFTWAQVRSPWGRRRSKRAKRLLSECTLAILLVVLSLFGTVSALEYPLLDNNVSAASNYTDFNNSTIAQ